MSWGPPIRWPMGRHPDAKPDFVKAGEIILSDLIVRPHMVEWLALYPNQYPPEICSASTWQVKCGQSFQLTAPQGLPIEQMATHTVLSYFRVWQGNAPPLCLAFSEDRTWETASPTKREHPRNKHQELERA